MFTVQACHVHCTSLSCSLYKPVMFITLFPHQTYIFPSPFILSFYLKYTDNQSVKAGTTSSHSRFSRMLVSFP